MDIKQIKKIIATIEKTYEVEPTYENEGDCLNAKEGFELLIEKLKKL